VICAIVIERAVGNNDSVYRVAVVLDTQKKLRPFPAPVGAITSTCDSEASALGASASGSGEPRGETKPNDDFCVARYRE